MTASLMILRSGSDADMDALIEAHSKNIYCVYHCFLAFTNLLTRSLLKQYDNHRRHGGYR